MFLKYFGMTEHTPDHNKRHHSVMLDLVSGATFQPVRALKRLPSCLFQGRLVDMVDMIEDMSIIRWNVCPGPPKQVLVVRGWSTN